jgi:threonine synthase
MKFYSTNDHSITASFEEALLAGLPADYGLFTIPKEQIPKLSAKDIEELRGASYADIAYAVLLPYLREDFSPEDLKKLLEDAYDPAHITAPLQKIDDALSLLWLTHGPTCSFKDFAARFFGRSLNHFLRLRNKKRLVVVATSGDTGGAIADALHGLDSVFCIVLYPKDAVSEVQRRQMTTLGGNVHAFAIPGDFDVCQALAKRILNDASYAQQTFGDPEFITSANSISLGRLLPQIVFPFYAHAHSEQQPEHGFVMSVPSGNFGDMMGTVIAKAMGLPIAKIVCGVNENKTFTEFMLTGSYTVTPAVYSPSSAMIVSHPSNVARLIDLYGGHMYDERDPATQKVLRPGVIDAQPDMDALRSDIFSCSVDNPTHFSTMTSFYEKTGIIIEPHGAVGVEALRVYRENSGDNTPAVVYETADPAKFPADVQQSVQVYPEIPPQITAQAALAERIYTLEQQPISSLTLGKTCSDEQYTELCTKIAALKLI